MEAKGHQSSKDKKTRRKEVLEKKKAIEEIIKAASVVKDHVASFPPFCRYDRNGLSVYLESECGEQLSSPLKTYIQSLLKVNMEGAYGSEWPTEEKVKRREMVAPEARYIVVRKSPNTALNEISVGKQDNLTSTLWKDGGDHVIGFLHYRFVIEEDIPVVYVYELQLESCAQGKGLGKFLMQLIELIARKIFGYLCKAVSQLQVHHCACNSELYIIQCHMLCILQNRMGAVMLTVQKTNVLAMNFYMSKLRYTISSMSPSRVDPLIGAEKSYEILCKTFDSEAKAKLEEIEA